MASIINGSSPTVTFSDGTTQATSAIVSGYVPYANLPAGSVLQVVNATYSSQASSATATWADTGLTATITPKFATSKVLIIASQNGLNKWTNNTNIGVRLLNGSTVLKVLENTAGYTNNTTANQVASAVISYLDSPATTSATTYKTQFNNGTPAGNVYIQDTSATSSITLMEIAG